MNPEKSRPQNEFFNFLNTGLALTALNIIFMAFSPAVVKFQLFIYLSLLCWILALAFWILGLKALKNLGKPENPQNYMTTTKVVDSGIFGYFRHPQYVAFLLFNLGIILKVQSISTTLTGILAIIFILIGIKEEEKKLMAKFGDAYREYKKKVKF